MSAVANYFRSQIRRGQLVLADPDRAAALFTQMICAELHECLLFGSDSRRCSELDFHELTRSGGRDLS